MLRKIKLLSIVRFVKNLLIDLPYIIRFFVVVGLIILAIRLIIVIIKKVIKNKKAKKAAKQSSASVNKPEEIAKVEVAEEKKDVTDKETK